MTLPLKQTLEREIKLRVELNFALPKLPGEPLAPRMFPSTYYDTEGHPLARDGITLRHRIDAQKGVWQLKLPLDTIQNRSRSWDQ